MIWARKPACVCQQAAQVCESYCKLKSRLSDSTSRAMCFCLVDVMTQVHEPWLYFQLPSLPEHKASRLFAFSSVGTNIVRNSPATVQTARNRSILELAYTNIDAVCQGERARTQGIQFVGVACSTCLHQIWHELRDRTIPCILASHPSTLHDARNRQQGPRAMLRLAILRNHIFIPGKGKIGAQQAGLVPIFARDKSSRKESLFCDVLRFILCMLPGCVVCWRRRC